MLFAHIKKLVHRTITSANGLVSFKSNVEMPLKVTCEFSPVQEGTGDPSPDNVRPISGWTGCEIGQGGSNIFNAQADIAIPVKPAGHKYYHASPNSYILGIHYTSFKYYGSSYITDFTKTQTGFTYSTTNASYTVGYLVKVYEGEIFGAFANMINSGMTVEFCTDDFDTIKMENSANNKVLTVPASSKYAFVRFNASKPNTLIEVSDIVIWHSKKPDSYVAYESLKSIPITFTDPTTGDPMTVYGGTVTLNEDGSADVTATWIYGTPNYSALGARFYSDGDYLNTYNYMGYGAFKDFPEPANHSKIISDKAVRGSFSTNTNPIVMNTASNFIYFGIKTELLESDDLAGIRAYLIEHAPVICYPLKQENYITYHFSNIGQLNSFLGTNNIWHNMNGDITVEYYNYQ